MQYKFCLHQIIAYDDFGDILAYAPSKKWSKVLKQSFLWVMIRHMVSRQYKLNLCGCRKNVSLNLWEVMLSVPFSFVNSHDPLVPLQGPLQTTELLQRLSFSRENFFVKLLWERERETERRRETETEHKTEIETAKKWRTTNRDACSFIRSSHLAFVLFSSKPEKHIEPF